jgi:FkbM family methyltransferase
MKIGMLVHDLAVSGGYQKLVLRLSQHLIKEGHQVVIYTPLLNKKDCYPELIKNQKIVTIDRPRPSGKGKSSDNVYDQILDEYRQLAHEIDEGLDALIIHDEVSLLALNFVHLSKKTTITWMLNNQLTIGLGESRVKLEKYVRKNILKASTNLILDLRNNKINIMYKKALEKVDHFAVYDSKNKDLVKEVLKREADIVYAAADLEEFTKLRHLKSPSIKEFRILSVGVAFPHRRYEDLIDAVAILAKQNVPVKATIVGRRDLDKGYSRIVESRVKRLNLSDKINFIDYLSDKELLALYKDSDAFVFINDSETWGIAVFEALASGTPVVITANIGAADIVRHGRDGWVVPPRSPSKVSAALLEIYKDRKLAREKTVRAAERISQLVSWQSYTRRMLDLIERKDRTTGEIVSKFEIAKYLPSNPVIVEAGAHIGIDTVEMARLWEAATIHAFEPVPKVYSKLQDNVKRLKNVHTYEIALSDKTGVQEIFISGGRSDGSSSLLRPKEHLKTHPDVTFNEVVKVQTLTLNDWMSLNRIKHIDFLWLDMQGMELSVMKASSEVIREVKVIYTEVSLIETYEAAASYSEIKRWLGRQGFHPEIEKFPWEDMGNVLFIKDV